MTANRDSQDSAGNYYRRLEVGPGASHDEIVRAYRRLALGAHPDVHPEDPEASVRFREIAEAYEVLGDPARREAYDAIAPIPHSIRVRHRQSAGGSDGGPTTAKIRATPPISVLGGNEPTRDIPLRVGPVHVGPSPARDEAADSATPLSALLDSWLRR
jgi:curved DNA-binding protein CbpA